mmetsp:Transcript_5453/g.16713  ORF Transcript_5453/g.16713 Transcript_5453/m.16713 type:complete len:203 (-) Transcript_5453:2479-3087(-)
MMAAGACARCRYSNSARRAMSIASSCHAESASIRRPFVTIAGDVGSEIVSTRSAWLLPVVLRKVSAVGSSSGEELCEVKRSGSASTSISSLSGCSACAAVSKRASMRRILSSEGDEPVSSAAASARIMNSSHAAAAEACRARPVAFSPLTGEWRTARRMRPPTVFSIAPTACETSSTWRATERSTIKSCETGRIIASIAAPS